jgi:cysteine desulfurase
VARAKGVLMHTDAAQSIGKVALDVHQLGVDMMTVVGHKFGAPKGIAALFIRCGWVLTACQ